MYIILSPCYKKSVSAATQTRLSQAHKYPISDKTKLPFICRLFAVYFYNKQQVFTLKHKTWLLKNRIRKPFIKDYKISLKVKKPFGKDEVTGSNPVISSNVKTALESRFQSFSAAVFLFL